MECMMILGLREYTFMEDRDHVFSKMQAEVVVHPEADFVVIILINEAMSYKSPSPDSTVFETLMPKDITNSDPLFLRLFIRQYSTLHQFNKPMKVTDHN